MPYRNKTYICFDGDNDMRSYRLMTAWSANPRFEFEFYNAHDLNTARDTSQEESIKRQLMERFRNSKCLIVLIGEHTRNLRKFVKWEMDVAIRLELPIIGVNLNNNRYMDELCPPTIRDTLAIFVPFNMRIIEYAMKHWPNEHALHKRKNPTPKSFRYTDVVYKNLGI